MYNPVSTYRIQFHKGYTFAHLEAAIPFLQKLGIKTLYASPIFEAVPGSTHGYDGINPHRINPELGTEEDLRRISGRLREIGIGWLQDIVPNHMAFHTGNEWLMDVLEKGRRSPYASYFDILWNVDDGVMVPFLGAPLEEVVKKGELKVAQQDGHWAFEYFGNRYPLNSSEGARTDLSGEELLRLAEAQHYRLCHWQETDSRINYRRFFTVNGLICLNIHDKQVFHHYHQYIAKLYQDGVFTGLRIDHIDGLYDPTKYLEDLRSLVGEDAYIVVEKILEPGERLPRQWPVQGNTGYDFLSLVNNLLTRNASEKAFTEFYQKLVDEDTGVHQQLTEKKAHILHTHMAGELDNLTRLFGSLSLADAEAKVMGPAIGAFLIQCPVYRHYGRSLPLAEEEAAAVSDILDRIEKEKNEGSAGAGVLREVLLRKPALGDEDYNRRALHFYQRLMQFTGPLMAKGVEDTLMYTYNRFIGHNDVGDSPETFGIRETEFHKAMMERQEHWPLSINTTSTHDTKRGEDARAMLNVLTHVPNEWTKAVEHWRTLAAPLKQKGAPDAADEYFIYKTIFATYPFDESEAGDYEDRLTEYLQKALREGKRNSDWANPNEAYESAAISFATALLKAKNPFWQSFSAFRNRLLDCGMIQSLAQAVLKYTCPGVSDTYQGSGLWDLSMVDPDNRRPVDYERRAEWLDEFSNLEPQPWKGLWAQRANGKIKLWLLQKMLSVRADHADLFQRGQYIPLRTTGRLKDHVFAYARRYGNEWIVVAIPLYLAALQEKPLDINWADTAIQLPPHAPDKWQLLLSGVEGEETVDGSIPMKELFRDFPIALLKMRRETTARSAGVLMPITSLPTSYSIGDIGPDARLFARKLARAGQSYWQLLPLNPVSGGSGFSPYSSVSTMAGNPLLISPDMLVEDGLLTESEVATAKQSPTDQVDYTGAESKKNKLLDAAFARFKSGGFAGLKDEVSSFQRKESSWVDDFALYVVIKRTQEQKAWFQWPVSLRTRDEAALWKFRNEYRDEIEKEVWQQALFSRQWNVLRGLCQTLDIKLIGDLPFYASYDSADVWMHPEIFSVDAEGKMTGVAGVPPDYFSKTGQLWGMPTFKWDVLKDQKYKWWIDRLRKNLQLYDVLRIDHFRAMETYWEVPAGEENAVHGQWLEGPRTEFFDAVRDALGGLPFIAEDLGEKMEDVYVMRDALGLPGMKVMQFAFGENLPTSVDAPHNYGKAFVAYTGTHDNNTTLGWFRNETTPEDRDRLAKYVGCPVKEKNAVEILSKLVYGSVAQLAILPMQDVLHLDERARMNIPGAGGGNWRWRMKPDAFTDARIAWLLEMARCYNRF